MTKYIVFDSDSSASRLMFFDIRKMENAIETSKVFDIQNPILRFINKVHMSGRIDHYIHLPLKQVWDGSYLLSHIEYSENENYIIVFTNISIRKFRLEYLKKLHERDNVFFVLVAVDSFVNKELSPLGIMQKLDFDLVYSFDSKDCADYNLKHTVSLYSKRTDICPSEHTASLFFVGRDKDRLVDLQYIAKEVNDIGCNCNFSILNVKKEDREKIDGVTYLDKIRPYDMVLPDILSSDCLLDLVQRGQVGLTMRVYEAIFYNKKLITNNPNVKMLEYYNPSYIQIIDDVSKIDYEFLQEKIPVNYHYQNDYSPIYFLRSVERRLVEMGKL